MAVKTGSKVSLLKSLFFLLFFACVFFFFTNPLNTITDFWWHISTGRWIWQNGSLPASDPFSIAALSKPNIQGSVTLQGYWLAQTSYYLIYKLFGLSGIVFYKAFLLTLIFFALWRILLFKGIEHFTALALISPLLLLVKPFEYMRPQIFSFLFSLLIFHVVEKGLKRLRQEGREKTRILMLLPVILGLWANMHSGYIVGIAMIGVYAFSETIKYVSKRNALSPTAFRKFMLWLVISVAASCLNPNHIQPIVSSISIVGYSPTQNIDEYARTWVYYSHTLFYLYLALTSVTLLVLLFSWRKVELSHVLLYGCFAVVGMAVFRFSIFFTLLSLAIASGYFAVLTGPIVKPLRRIAITIAVIVMLMTANYSFRNSSLVNGALPNNLPTSAANFILENNLSEGIFNPYEWGGYLMWHLNPRYKVFIDSRVMNPAQFYDYLTANYGRKDEIFNKYGIKTVVFYVMNLKQNGMPDVVYALLKDDNWKMVYLDEKNAIIFVRADTAPQLPALSKKEFTDGLIQSALAWSTRLPNSSNAYLMLGQLYRVQGDSETAKKYFREVLRVDPGNVFASSYLRP